MLHPPSQEITLITSKTHDYRRKRPEKAKNRCCLASCCHACTRFFKLNQIYYGLNQMRHLPKWLKADICYNSIVLSGTPASTDLGKLVIQVYRADLIILEFDLKIKKNEENLA